MAGRASISLNFIIVGGGIAGLATACGLVLAGHQVRLFEQSSPGATLSVSGVRVPPNGARVLMQWGLEDELRKRSVTSPSVDFVDMENGDRLGSLAWYDEILSDLGSPFFSMHHADLLDLLYEAALKLGVEITSNARVTSVSPSLSSGPSNNDTTSKPSSSTDYDYSKPSITLATGQVYQADIVIGADGPQSIVRPIVEDDVPEEQPHKLVVYTGTISVDLMPQDNNWKEVVEMRYPIWMGDMTMVMSYPVREEKEWSMTLWQEEELDEDTPVGWGTKVNPASAVTGPLERRLRTMIDRFPTFSRVKANFTPHAELWVDDSETILLVGEAAHPMTAGGMSIAAVALEDASALGSLFSHLRERSQIPTLLHAFEDIRQPRAYNVQQLEFANLVVLSLPPGPNRDMRNAVWAAAKKNALKQTGVSSRPDLEPDEREIREQWREIFEIWAYDARDAAEDWWIKWGMLAERSLGLDPTQSGNSKLSPTDTFAGFTFSRVDTTTVVHED